MPVDRDPTASGNLFLDRVGTRDLHSRVVTPDEEPERPRYKSHFATCPNSRSHRRRATG